MRSIAVRAVIRRERASMILMICRWCDKRYVEDYKWIPSRKRAFLFDLNCNQASNCVASPFSTQKIFRLPIFVLGSIRPQLSQTEYHTASVFVLLATEMILWGLCMYRKNSNSHGS